MPFQKIFQLSEFSPEVYLLDIIKRIDIKELENWLWDITSILRGPVEAYNYKYSYGAKNLEL